MGKIDANVVTEVEKILRKCAGFIDGGKFRESVIKAEDYSVGEWRIELANNKLSFVGFSIGYPAIDQLNHMFLSKDSIVLYFDKETSGA